MCINVTLVQRTSVIRHLNLAAPRWTAGNRAGTRQLKPRPHSPHPPGEAARRAISKLDAEGVEPVKGLRNRTDRPHRRRPAELMRTSGGSNFDQRLTKLNYSSSWTDDSDSDHRAIDLRARIARPNGRIDVEILLILPRRVTVLPRAFSQHSRSQHLRNGATTAVARDNHAQSGRAIYIMPLRRSKGRNLRFFSAVNLKTRASYVAPFIPLIIPIYFNSRHNQIRGDSASEGSLPKHISHVGAKSAARRA